jgi:transcription antitermination factor NusG
MNVAGMRNFCNRAKSVMSKHNLLAGLIGIAMAVAIAGCGHKMVATGGDHSVPLFPDEATYLKISQLRQQGGVSGMLGDVGKNLAAKQIDDQTPVKVISNTGNGANVEIIDGPMKGQSGFVAKQNLD